MKKFFIKRYSKFWKEWLYLSHLTDLTNLASKMNWIRDRSAAVPLSAEQAERVVKAAQLLGPVAVEEEG